MLYVVRMRIKRALDEMAFFKLPLWEVKRKEKKNGNE